MTTPVTTSNKTALRASLKKEDESLAERLVATDVPLVAPPEPEAAAPAPPTSPVVAASPKATPVATPAPKVSDKAVVKAVAEVAPGAVGKADTKGAKKAGTAKAVEAKAKPISKKAAAKAGPSAKKAAKAGADARSVKEDIGKPSAKLAEAVERLESAAKAKGDKLVRYTVELLKSEEAAIEALRAELSKAAGWAASKSDILRAGVRLFAEQRLEQMKELLTALAAPAKGKKKG
jgi:hypothetical protein